LSPRFSQMPTLEEFIEHAHRHYGFTFRKIGVPFRGPRGDARLDYLWRDKPNAYAPLPNEPHDYRLSEDDVRSLCARSTYPLKISGYRKNSGSLFGARSAAHLDAGPALEKFGDGGHVLAVEAGGSRGLVDLADHRRRQHRHAETLREPRGQAEILA
jgi:hypothetical protein